MRKIYLHKRFDSFYDLEQVALFNKYFYCVKNLMRTYG